MMQINTPLDKNGRRIVKPYPPEFIMMTMMLMGNGVEASRVNSNITAVFEGTGKWDFKRYNMPDETTCRRWRFGMTHICQVQIGLELTKAANNKQQVLTGDGTPVAGKHVESFVITTDDVNIAMIPWVQAGKASEMSAENTVKMIDQCQSAYNVFYAKCEDKDGLPPPVTQGSLILNVAAAVNDHASNETARVEFLSKIKARIAVKLGIDDTNPLVSFYCNTHKAMLLAKALRQADHDYLSTICSDRDDGEFRTSNLLDSFEIQLSKMFGHHIDAYAFGHGVDKFPAWMQATHGDRWRGFKRLVGNRAQIFLENSVCMYYMAEYYLEYCDYVLRQAKVGNALHRRLDAKLRSSEMRAGT